MPRAALVLIVNFLLVAAIVGFFAYGILIAAPRERAALDVRCERLHPTLVGRITPDGQRCVDARGDVFLAPEQ